MDLAKDLPPCMLNSYMYRHVLIMVDHLTKQQIFKPLQTKETSELVEVMHRHVFCEFRLPYLIILDHGSAFMSHFWRQYYTRYNVLTKLSSANHPETNSQSKNTIKGLKNYLRAYVNYAQDNWAWFLPNAQFAANNQVSKTMGITPFFACHAYHPHTGSKPPGIYRDPPNHPQALAAD
jgi:hypothetical protein